jgi:brefeldin A-inhibited guanine nucleotide-exchange protein
MDLRSQPMRSKLLALHLIAAVLQSHLYIFTTRSKALSENPAVGDALPFIEYVKEFLILTLSRNASSPVPPVFEVSMEIFGKTISGLRYFLKKELAVFFTEIVIPILEGRKTVAWHQRYMMFKSLQTIFSDPANDGGRILVELYVNYDCDVEATAKENIWERLINTISKTLSQHSEGPAQTLAPFMPIGSFVSSGSHGNDTPALTTANLVALSRDQVRELFQQTGDMAELKRVGLDFLVEGVLNGIVTWCDLKKGKQSSALANLGIEREVSGSEKLSTMIMEEEEDVADPQAFGDMKMKKQAITEGVKKFNFKYKKVTGINSGHSVSFGDTLHSFKATEGHCTFPSEHRGS